MTDTTMSTRTAARARERGRGGDALLPSGALLNVLVLAVLSGAAVAVWLLVEGGGWEYYTAPVAERGTLEAHRVLRPAGTIGNLLGIVGTLFMISTLPYVARKKVKWLARLGSVQGWLEFHVFCGVFGPILITFHTSFRFSGIVSVAYWAMVLVVLSGLVGRYLFVRIPKTIRGVELSRAEVEDRVRELKEQLVEAGLPVQLMERIEEIERDADSTRSFPGTLVHGVASRRRLRALHRDVRRSGLRRDLTSRVLQLLRERTVLRQRLAHLQRTRQLFQLWHVFHRPLVWVMFLIFLVHLGVAVYFGYTVFGGD